MKEVEEILIAGERYHVDEFLDENGKYDLPPPISAEALGVTDRTIRNYTREAGRDYNALSYYLANKCPKTPQIMAWQSAFALWRNRQGFEF